MTPRSLPRVPLLPPFVGVLLLLSVQPGCEDVVRQVEPASGSGSGQEQQEGETGGNRYGFEKWYADFPYEVAMPAVRKPGAWYSRSRAAALRRVAANLEGTCSQDAWRMAREFFDRCQEEAESLLIESMDRGLVQRRHNTLALNAVKAMGRVENDAYADALLRAVEYPDPSIREAAVSAMIKAGNAEVVRKVQGYYLQLTLKERLRWMRAALAHLPDDELAPILRDLLTKVEHSHMRLPVIRECMKMSPARAVKLLSPVFDDLPPDLQVFAAAAFHAVGDRRGLGVLRKAIRGQDRARQALAVDGARSGRIEPLVDDILELTSQDLTGNAQDVALRVAIVQSLQGVPGKRIDDVLLMYTAAMAAPVRQAAYQALSLRGKTGALEQRLEVARTGTGMQRWNAIADLVSCRYEKVLPVVMGFYNEASATQQMDYIRELARFGTSPAFAHMKEIFMEPEHRLPTREVHTNVTFLGIQFSNMDESVYEILGLLESLPRQEYRRRAALVHALSNAAGARYDQPWAKDVYAALRRIVFDPKEIPQMRLLALEYLRKDLRIDDAMLLKRVLRKEDRPMRSYLSDYLFEYF